MTTIAMTSGSNTASEDPTVEVECVDNSDGTVRIVVELDAESKAALININTNIAALLNLSQTTGIKITSLL